MTRTRHFRSAPPKVTSDYRPDNIGAVTLRRTGCLSCQHLPRQPALGSVRPFAAASNVRPWHSGNSWSSGAMTTTDAGTFDAEQRGNSRWLRTWTAWSARATD
jgi:hypothetical protein